MNQGDLYMGSTYGIVGYTRKGKPIYGHTALPPSATQAPPQPQQSQYKPPVTKQPNANLASTQQGIRSPRKPQRRGNISQFLISLAQAQQVGAGAGSPLNIG